MKKSWILIVILFLLTTSCDTYNKVKKEGEEAYQNVKQEAAEVKETYSKTKKAVDSIEKTIDSADQTLKDIKEIGE